MLIERMSLFAHYKNLHFWLAHVHVLWGAYTVLL